MSAYRANVVRAANEAVEAIYQLSDKVDNWRMVCDEDDQPRLIELMGNIDMCYSLAHAISSATREIECLATLRYIKQKQWERMQKD